MTLFDWLKEINLTKRPPSAFEANDWKTFTPYMINRYLSLHTELLDVVNYIQKFVSLPKEMTYDMYRRILPKQPRFAKYIKSKNIVKHKHTELISRYFEVSNKEAKQYEEMLTKEDVKMIKQTMGQK